jgi:predicted RNA-binding Zn ribbon-like protein
MQKNFAHLKLIGGAPCLDFANTVDWRTGEQPRDWLHDYEELILWCRYAEALEASQAQRLLRRAASDPDEAQAAFSQAIALREAIYHIFTASASGDSVDDDLALLNAVLSDVAAHLRLASTQESFVWDWHDVEDRLSWPSWLIARSAADLLTSERRGRVHECAGPGCGWLFLDTSRNRSRRWCDMADCGNRAKARRNYARKRGRAVRTTRP